MRAATSHRGGRTLIDDAVPLREDQMGNKVLGTFIVAAVALSPYAAAATVVKLSGTFSKDQVANDCAAAGGVFGTTKSGGYNCVSISNGNTVQCTSKGQCTGTITRTTVPSRPTLGGVLGARPIATQSGNIRSGGPSTGPTKPPPPVEVPPTARGK
jgi:hypothetical protein